MSQPRRRPYSFLVKKNKQANAIVATTADPTSEMVADVNSILDVLTPVKNLYISTIQDVQPSDPNFQNYRYYYGLLTKLATYRSTLFGTSIYSVFINTLAARNPGGTEIAGTIGSFIWGCETSVTGIDLGCSATCASSIPPDGATRANGQLCSQEVIAANWTGNSYDIIALNPSVQSSTVIIVANNTEGFDQDEINQIVASSPSGSLYTLYTYNGTTYTLTKYQNVTADQLPRRSGSSGTTFTVGIVIVIVLFILIVIGLIILARYT